MHDDEVGIDAELVRGLIDTQFPRLRALPITRSPSTGTVNAVYRLGADLCVRMPRVELWAAQLEHELEWLPRLASLLPLTVPEPVAEGEPGNGYPFRWAVYRWIEGETYATERVDDERSAARDLGSFVAALRRIDPSTGPATGRAPLDQLDVVTRSAIESARDVLDGDAVTAAWDRALLAPPWTGAPVWRHGDLLPPNLLVSAGRLEAVIDFGGVGVGDPAADVVAAWSVFGREGRDTFRDALDVDDATWDRARGYALHQALLIIPYYPDTNPDFVTMAERTVREVLADEL